MIATLMLLQGMESTDGGYDASIYTVGQSKSPRKLDGGEGGGFEDY